MNRLWSQIVGIAEKSGAIAAGTPRVICQHRYVLAEKNYIPRVFAATVRVVSAVRSLVAIECGAKGPHKDCGYEGVYVKAITARPFHEGVRRVCAFVLGSNVAASWRMYGAMSPFKH
jgi:methanol--5-hydroxybenzimidazolylcobamide Co-methyltransferase